MRLTRLAMETVLTRRHPKREETPDLIPGYFARIDKGDLLTLAEERREDMSEQRPVHTREPAEGAEGDVVGPGAEKAGDPSNPGATDEANAGGFSPMHPQEQAEVGDEDIGAPGAARSGSGD